MNENTTDFTYKTFCRNSVDCKRAQKCVYLLQDLKKVGMPRFSA